MKFTTKTNIFFNGHERVTSFFAFIPICTTDYISPSENHRVKIKSFRWLERIYIKQVMDRNSEWINIKFLSKSEYEYEKNKCVL